MGTGATAEVWRATRAGVQAVLKRVRVDQRRNPAYLHAFETEAMAMAALADVPEVLRCVDAGVGWVALEPGSALDPRPPHGVVDAVERALAAAHARGIVHRDPKLANVLHTARGFVLGDWGSARIDGHPDPTPAVGSPEAFAPERLRGEPATPATDRYALGVLAWTVYTGAPPWPPTRWDALLAVDRAALPPFRPLAAVSAEREAEVRAWLSVDPALRQTNPAK